MKRIRFLTAAVLCLAMLAGCSSHPAETPVLETAEAAVRKVTLTGSGADFNCGGVSVSGSVITVSAPGEYLFSGALTDGRIVVNTGSVKERVSITLSGVSVTSLDGPAFLIERADKVNIILAEGTENVFTAGTAETLASFDDTATGAAIYGNDDFDIKGPGSLKVCGYINNGIGCKNDIDIDGGEIYIEAANNGIKGNDSVEINGGNITVECRNDGIKSTNAEVIGKGFVKIDGGKVSIAAEGDGISAQTDVTVNAGEVSITAEKQGIKTVTGTVTVNEAQAKVLLR